MVRECKIVKYQNALLANIICSKLTEFIFKFKKCPFIHRITFIYTNKDNEHFYAYNFSSQLIHFGK